MSDNTDHLKTVGERLKYIRNVLGVSQDILGEDVGVTGSAIAHIEKSRRPLTEQMCKSICRARNIDYFWLTEGTGEPFRNYPNTLINSMANEYNLDDMEKAFFTEYVKLSKEERAAIKKYIKGISRTVGCKEDER